MGSNDEALEETLFLTKFANQIHLIVPTPELKARAGLVTEVMTHPKITVQLGTRLKEISGNGNVQGLHLLSQGGEETILPVAGVFVYLQGNQPIADYLLGQLETTPSV